MVEDINNVMSLGDMQKVIREDKFKVWNLVEIEMKFGKESY